VIFCAKQEVAFCQSIGTVNFLAVLGTKCMVWISCQFTIFVGICDDTYLRIYQRKSDVRIFWDVVCLCSRDMDRGPGCTE
jgi:hypothetical protein